MSAADSTFSVVRNDGWFPEFRANLSCQRRRPDEEWFRKVMDERIGGLRLCKTLPALLELETVYFVPGSISLYDSDGKRISESCMRRTSGLHLAGPESIAVPRDCRIVSEPMLYLSWVQDHWGHFLTEGINRLWARAVYPELGSLHCFTTFGYALAPQVLDYLNVLGVSGERLRHFREPVRMQKCFVPAASFNDRAEAFAVHLWPSQQVAALTGYADATAPSSQPVYLSRSRLGTGRRIRGEPELEQELSRLGVRIVHPEQLSLREQITLFNTHQAFIGCWGSAFHGLCLAFAPERLTTHVLCEGVPGPNYLMFDAILGCASNYVDALNFTEGEPQQWPNLDLTIDIEALLAYLRGAGCV